jgi:hypothetical protein
LTFADAANKVGDTDNGRPRMPTGDRDNVWVERLHPMVTNQRYRPTAEVQVLQCDAGKPTLG